VPAPYVARYHWVALETFGALKDSELKPLLKNAYELIRDKLPKKVADSLGSEPVKPTSKVAPKPNKSKAAKRR